MKILQRLQLHYSDEHAAATASDAALMRCILALVKAILNIRLVDYVTMQFGMHSNHSDYDLNI